MTRLPMRDVIVVIPGITGSVLQHDGRDVWAVSGGAVWGALRSLMRNFDRLVLTDDDLDADVLDDGVTAPRLVDDVHLIPGLWKIDGYSGLLNGLRERFDVVAADPGLGIVSNLQPFPYDWRRDNRVASRRLGALVNDVLPAWRHQTGYADAKVIVIAHSMGGLVASHWVHVGDGAEQCRAVLTLGTPFRGSPNAAASLGCGVRKLGVDLTDLMRSFTSVYQLMPIYPCVRQGGTWHRPAETSIPGIDPVRATHALEFHREIMLAAETTGGELVRPYLGLRQETLESLVVADGLLREGSGPPEVVEAQLGGGDGTVPRVSAIPVHQSAELTDTSVVERHSVMQNNRFLFEDLCAVLTRLQARSLAAVRGPDEPSPVGGADTGAAIQLDVPDLAPAGQPVDLVAKVVGGEDVPLTVEVRGNGAGPVLTWDTAGAGTPCVLEPGVYRVVARPTRLEHQDITEVSDVLVVADPAAPG